MEVPFINVKSKLLYVLKNKLIVDFIWYAAPMIATLLQIFSFHKYNNYLIYKGVYFHTLSKINLYNSYPLEYVDKNHYGILFSVLIAPFTLLPDWLGIILYQLLQIIGLHYMIRKLPLNQLKQHILLLFLVFESIANAQNIQTNTFIAVVMLGAFVWIQNKKEAQSAFIAMLGFFVKLYGIVALGLFFFVKNKPKYILSLLVSAVVLFLFPLLFTDFHFLLQSYQDWYTELIDKNGTNSDLDNIHQNTSVLGMYVKLTGNVLFNYAYIIIPAFIIQLLPLVRFNYFSNSLFQIKYLATLMLFIILFNSATETSTHIIGATGVGIWWLTSDEYKSKKMLWFILFVFVLGTLSTTDLVPKYFNYEIVRKYSLKAFPYLVVWCICIYQLCFSSFKNKALIYE